MSMQKILLYCLIALFIAFDASTASAQTVYFQRFLAGAGTLSAVSPSGPAATLADLAANLSNARSGGVESNGAGLIFYTDRASDQILAADTSGNIYVIVLPFSGLSSPQAISLDLSNNFLYVADVGNSRIVRINLSLPLPTNKVQVVVDASAGVTNEVEDLKFNPSDGYLYWTNSGAFHRAAVAGQSMPVQSGETLLTANSIGVRFFDFDLKTPQLVYFSSGSGGFEGIYSAPVPRVGDTPNLSESNILDISATPDVTISGIAIDKNGPFFCYTAINTPAPVMRCGDRTTTNPVNFPEILSAEFTVPPSFMVIDSPALVVRPNTKLGAPTLQLNLSIPNPQVRILLKQFDEAALKAIEEGVASASAGRVGFRYAVEIKRAGNAEGKSSPKLTQDKRRSVVKRNELTARNLKKNSTYQVRYRIEITRKQKGQPEKVVKRTTLSPFSSFVVPKRSP